MPDEMSADFAVPQMSIPPGSFIRQDSETIKFRLNVDDLVNQIEHDLKGEHWVREQMKGWVTNKEGQRIEVGLVDENGVPVMEEHWKKVGIAKCNDYGAKCLTGEIRKFIGKNSFLSDLNEEEINMLCRNIGHILNNLVEDRFDDYNIDAKDVESIIFGITELLFISLKRAEMGRERDSISKMQTVTEHNITGSGGQRSVLNPFNWGKSG